MIYIYRNIPKEERKNIYLFFLLYISFALVFGKIYTMVTSKEKIDFFHVGVSSIGGVIGTILSAYIYEKIENHDKKIMKYTILSLPLVYSISKLGCFLVGCCYGIPYSGVGYVFYTEGLNIKLFPVQLLEVLCFFLLFLYLNYKKNHRKIIAITLMTSSILKFILDFFRYEHTIKFITSNQVVCIIIVLATLLYEWKERKKHDNRRIKTKTN